MTTILGLIDGFKNNPHVLILVIVLVGLLIASYVLNRTDKRKGQDGELLLGLKPLSTRGFWEYIGKKKFSVLSPWFAPVSISDAYQGKYKGYDVCLFQIGVSDGSEGGASQTAIHIKSPSLDLPRFLLKPAGFGQRLSDLFGYSNINFPSAPHFSDNYYLKGDNEGRIRSLFQPQILRFFQEHEGITVESSGNELVIFNYRDQAKKDNFATYIDRAINTLELFSGGELKPELGTSFAGDRPEVKAQKRMTASLFNVAANIFIIAMVYYQIGGIFAHIITAILILESIALLLYTLWKKKELKQGRV